MKREKVKVWFLFHKLQRIRTLPFIVRISFFAATLLLLYIYPSILKWNDGWSRCTATLWVMKSNLKLEADFLSWQELLAYSMQIFIYDFSLLSQLMWALTAWFKNFQPICYSQWINMMSQYNDSGSSRCSKWPNNHMIAVVKHCQLFVQGRRGCRERWPRATTG